MVAASQKTAAPAVSPCGVDFEEHTSLVERKPGDKKHALLVVGKSASDHLAHIAFLPTNLNLECATVQYFGAGAIELEQIQPATQLAIYVDANIEEVARKAKLIEHTLQKCALIFNCKEHFDISRPANETVARLGLNDPKITPFYQDFTPPADWHLINVPDMSTLPPSTKLVAASRKDFDLYFKMQRIIKLAAKMNKK